MYPGTKNAKKSNFYVHNAQFFTVIALCMYSISSKNGHQKAVFKKWLLPTKEKNTEKFCPKNVDSSKFVNQYAAVQTFLVTWKSSLLY
jgi:hypothetical protein